MGWLSRSTSRIVHSCPFESGARRAHYKSLTLFFSLSLARHPTEHFLNMCVLSVFSALVCGRSCRVLVTDRWEKEKRTEGQRYGFVPRFTPRWRHLAPVKDNQLPSSSVPRPLGSAAGRWWRVIARGRALDYGRPTVPSPGRAMSTLHRDGIRQLRLIKSAISVSFG